MRTKKGGDERDVSLNSEVTEGRNNSRKRPKGYAEWRPRRGTQAVLDQVDRVLREYRDHLRPYRSAATPTQDHTRIGRPCKTTDITETAPQTPEMGISGHQVTRHLATPEAGETIELCNVQRKDESHPCPNIEPCPKHCGATLRGERAGRKCSNNAMVNGRCRMHGGHAARGIGHGQFKDGKRSRYRPKGIKDSYEEALADPAYTENRDELALARAHIQQVLDEMGEDSEDWFRILNERVTIAKELRDQEQMTAFLLQVEEIFDLIRRGSQKYQKRRELMNWIDLRQKVSVAETRRLEKEHQMLTREQVLLLMNAMGRIVYEEVRDREVRARIAERAAQLTA